MKNLTLPRVPKLLCVAVLAAVAMVIGPCFVQAGTITYQDEITPQATDWSEPLSLPPFVSNQETLTQVTLVLTGSLGTTLNVVNMSGSASSGIASTQSTFTVSSGSLNLNLSPLNLVADVNFNGLPADSTLPISASQTGSDTYVYMDPGMLQQDFTTGPVLLSASTSTYIGCLYQPSCATTYSQPPTPPLASLTATITYTYAPTLVPEPSAFALFGAGVAGLLAYAWRRRK